MIFDSHAHYLSSAFDEDREVLLSHLFQTTICGIIEGGTTVADSRKALTLAEQYPSLWAAVGIHPQEIRDFSETDIDELRILSTHPKAVAIGEIGLDYHYNDGPSREIQHRVFREQLALAKDVSLPVVIHDRDAHEDTLSLLKQFRPIGVVHCFSGSVEMAREIVKLGMYIGIGGVVTFKNARKLVEVAKELPLDRLLLETDAPYLAPVPLRGERCDSSMILHTAATLAALRGLTTQEILSVAEENARRLFAL